MTGSQHSKAQVWDAQTGQLVTTLWGHSKEVFSASYSPDGRRIVTGSGDKTARVWDAQTGQLVTTLQGHSGYLRSVNYSPDGRRIITGSGDKTARVWDAQTGQLVTTLQGHSGHVASASYSPDGRRIVTGSGHKTAQIWNAQTGQLVTTLQGHSGDVTSASYSPDGRRIVTGSGDTTARVWDAQTGQLISTLQGHSGYVESASYSPDGRRIVTGSGDKTARVWDAQTGQLISTLQGHSEHVASASYSPDGLNIVTGSGDKTARVWDAQTGRLLSTLEHWGSVKSAVYSPDGSRIVTSSGDQTARVWDAQTGQLITTLQRNSGSVASASYSPDGRRIVTGNADRTARVWDAQTGQLISTLQGHSGGVEIATYSSDGRRIVTASGDTTARVWDTAPEIRSTEELLALSHCFLGQILQGEAIVPAAINPEACLQFPPKTPRPLLWDQRDTSLQAGIYALQAGRLVAAQAALLEARNQIEHFQDLEGLAQLNLAEAALSADDLAPVPASVRDSLRRIATKEQPRVWLELAGLAHDSLHHPRWALWALGELHKVVPSDPNFVASARASNLEYLLAAGLNDEVLQQASEVLATQTQAARQAVVAALAWVAALRKSAGINQQTWAQRAFDLYSSLEDGTTPGWTFDGIRYAFLNQQDSPSRTAALDLLTLLDQKKSVATTEKLGKLLGVLLRERQGSKR